MSKLKVGDSASVTRKFDQNDHVAYLRAIGDSNPLHVDKEFAATTPFKEPILAGAFVAGLFSGLLGSTLPGEGTIYLGQSSKFMAPILVSETVTATVEIVKIREDKPIVTLSTKCFKECGSLAIDGEAVVKVDPARLS